MANNETTYSHLSADVLRALDGYDRDVADRTLTTESGFATYYGPAHSEVWLPGNALPYFTAIGDVAQKLR